MDERESRAPHKPFSVYLAYMPVLNGLCFCFRVLRLVSCLLLLPVAGSRFVCFRRFNGIEFQQVVPYDMKQRNVESRTRH